VATYSSPTAGKSIGTTETSDSSTSAMASMEKIVKAATTAALSTGVSTRTAAQIGASVTKTTLSDSNISYGTILETAELMLGGTDLPTLTKEADVTDCPSPRRATADTAEAESAASQAVTSEVKAIEAGGVVENIRRAATATPEQALNTGTRQRHQVREDLPSSMINGAIINLELLSGSSDTFRTVAGTSYIIENVETEEGGNTTLGSSSFTPWSADNIIADYKSAVELQTEIDNNTILPNYKFPVRIIGNNDKIKDDKFWKVILMGGQFGDDTYNSIYNETTFEDYNFLYSTPYGANNILEMSSATQAALSTIQITYDYNYSLQEYQDANLTDSELLIPNMYLIQMFNGVDLETQSFDNDIYNMVSLEDTIDPTELLNSVTTQNPVAPPSAGSRATQIAAAKAIGYSATLEDPVLNLHTYLTASWVNTALSASTNSVIQNRLQNLMFDEDGITSTYANMSTNSYKFPYYVTINLPITTATDTDFLFGTDNTSMVDSIQANGFSTKFLKTLKEIFTSETLNVQPAVSTMAKSTAYISSSTETLVETVGDTNYKLVNFIDLLAYAYNNYVATTDNCYFIGGLTRAQSSVMGTTGIGRYHNSIGSLGVMNDMMTYLNTYFGLSSLEELYDLSQRYSETLAYRVDKIGGSATGDSSTQNVLQSYWVFNSDTIEDLKIYDSQIKYGEDYTYKCYAYQLVIGYRYKFSDIVISRNMGTDPTAQLQEAILSGKGDITDLVTAINAGELSCLEFFDPTTGEIADSLTADVTDPEGFGRSIELGEFNDFVTDAQELGMYKYLADFHLNYEPCIKLIEVPIYSKSLRVIDPFPNKVNVSPFQLLDNSQTLGFSLSYDTFDEEPVPVVITDTDETITSAYLNANDILDTTDNPYESVSNQRFIEVFRVDTKPAALNDFNNHLYSTIDLRIPNSKSSYSKTIFYDKVNTNQKYYYLFRAVNEQGTPGAVSEIYEAELVNDGGYNYAIFDAILKEELGEKIFTNPIKKFKKLLQLQPNMSQISMNLENVDYTQEAYTQVGNITIGNAEDLIFSGINEGSTEAKGKTFKVRLTSKKTGKKIDLNITYNLKSE